MLIIRNIGHVTDTTRKEVKYEGSAQIIFMNVHPNEIKELIDLYATVDDDYGREELNVRIFREEDEEYYGYFDTYQVIIETYKCGGFRTEEDAKQYVEKKLKRIGVI